MRERAHLRMPCERLVNLSGAGCMTAYRRRPVNEQHLAALGHRFGDAIASFKQIIALEIKPDFAERNEIEAAVREFVGNRTATYLDAGKMRASLPRRFHGVRRRINSEQSLTSSREQTCEYADGARDLEHTVVLWQQHA